MTFCTIEKILYYRYVFEIFLYFVNCLILFNISANERRWLELDEIDPRMLDERRGLREYYSNVESWGTRSWIVVCIVETSFDFAWQAVFHFPYISVKQSARTVQIFGLRRWGGGARRTGILAALTWNLFTPARIWSEYILDVVFSSVPRSNTPSRKFGDSVGD